MFELIIDIEQYLEYTLYGCKFNLFESELYLLVLKINELYPNIDFDLSTTMESNTELSTFHLMDL